MTLALGEYPGPAPLVVHQPSLRTIQAILFDFSGTLADCGTHWWDLEMKTTVREPLTRLQAAGYLEISPEQLDEADHIFANLHQEAKTTHIEISVRNAVAYVLDRLKLFVPLPYVDRAIEQAFHSCLPDVQPRPGAGETLAAVQNAGYRLALVSNARYTPFVDWALQWCHFLHYFPVRVISAEVNWRKPRPEIFNLALAALDVRPEQAVYVGDYHPYDVVGAAGAGLKTVWIPRPGTDTTGLTADAILDQLSDLPALLTVWQH